MKPEERAESILQAAMICAKDKGVFSITRQIIADQAGVNCTLVNHYFKDTANIIDKVIERACNDVDVIIISQALVAGHPRAKRALRKPVIKEKVTKYLGL